VTHAPGGCGTAQDVKDGGTKAPNRGGCAPKSCRGRNPECGGPSAVFSAELDRAGSSSTSGGVSPEGIGRKKGEFA